MINSKDSFSSKSRYKIKGKTSPRRKPRDISTPLMDIDTQAELQSKSIYEEYLMTEAEKRRLSLFYYARNRENPQQKQRVFMRRVISSGKDKKSAGTGTRSSAASGDGNSDDSDPELERKNQHSLYLFDQQSLADLLCISKKTLQNAYSNAPHELPVAIQIPHARGPRWTQKAVEKWLDERHRHTQKKTPVAPKRKLGRPRIAAAIDETGNDLDLEVQP